MAFFTGWLGKIGGADGGATLIGDLLRMRGIVLATAADAIDIWRSNGAGAALVSIADSALPSGAATSALQSAGNTSLASMALGTHVVAVTATTYATPLRWIHNYGAAGTLKIKAHADDTAQTLYLPQGGTFSCSQIVAVSDIAGGVTCCGGY